MKTIDELKARRADLAALCPEWEWAEAVRYTKLLSSNERKPYLEQGTGEDPKDFDKRAALADYAALTPLISERIEGAVWRRPPTYKAPESLQPFIDKATPANESLTELVKRACMEALWGRFAVVLIDRPKLGGALPLTQAEAEAASLDKPYGVVYPADRVLDYRVDSMGALTYIRLDGPCWQDGDTAVREIREIDANGIMTWEIRKPKGGAETLAGGAIVTLAPELVAAKRMPVIPVQYRAVDAVKGLSPLSAALQAEKAAFRLLSDIAFDLYLAGHPTMLIKTTMTDLTTVGVGASKYLRLTPGTDAVPGDDITYLEAELPGLAKQFERYASARGEIQQQAGVRPIAQESSGANPESGVAASIRVDSESYVLGNVATMAERVTWDILYTVALDMGVPVAGAELAVSYSKDFGIQSQERALLLAQTFRGLLGAQATATKEAIRRAVLAALDNLSPETEEAIRKEIESAGAYEPPAPDFGGNAQ